MEKTEFVFKAFISYTARDTQFVDKLEKWLVHLSEHADPDQNFKFFRDSSYSEAGEIVEESLKQRLNESEWLILVCSPYINNYKETEKNWVEFECSYYAYTLGRKDNIVCILSNSAPLDRDISLFYPESIKDLREKLAADMRGEKEWGKETSRIYAKITGLILKTCITLPILSTGKINIMILSLLLIRSTGKEITGTRLGFCQKFLTATIPVK